MRTNFKKYFEFSRKEKNGIIVLLSAILLAASFPFVAPFFIKEETIDYSLYENQLRELNRAMANVDSTAIHEIEWRYFNPDTISQLQLIEFGLKEKVASTFIAYRNTVKSFHSSNDLLKIYGIDENWLKRAEPWMIFNSKRESTSNIESIKSSRDIADSSEQKAGEELVPVRKINYYAINLNLADSAALVDVRGIGSVITGRILKYRSKLGGFVSIHQLSEVYNFPKDVLDSLVKYAIVDIHDVKKININNCSFGDLTRHPYIDYHQTKSVFKYRELMGNFTKISQLFENNILDSTTYRKITPYLSVE